MRHDGADIPVENVQVEVLTGRDLMEGFNGFLSTCNDANVFGELVNYILTVVCL